MITQPNQEYIKTRSALVGAFALVMVFLLAFSSSAWATCVNVNLCCYALPPSGTLISSSVSYAYKDCRNTLGTTTCYISVDYTEPLIDFGNGNYRGSVVGFCSDSLSALKRSCDYNSNSVFCPKCDENAWTCSTESRIEQVGSSGGNEITCINGQCFGLPTCSYKSIAKTTCRNECGDITEQEAETPAFIYEGACDDKLLTPDDCSQTKCVTSHKTGNYILYKVCGSGKVGNDGEQLLPQITQTGKGSCKDLGFDETPLNGSSSSTSVDSSIYTQDCLLYGIGCPAADSSGVDFSKAENRTPQNGCKCEPYDGINSMSRVVCPDGSTSVNFFSCEDFNKIPSSSSESPSSSSSSGGEEGGGGSSSLDGDWMTYSQGEDVKAALAVIDNDLEKNNSLTATGNGLLSQILSSLNSTGSASFTPDNYVLADSNYTGLVDTTKKSLLDSILSSLDTTNKMVDTLTISSTGKCPCLTFDFTNKPYIGKKFQVDFKSFWGVNFCDLVSTIVMGLASVVAFMLGIGMFIFAKKE